jgi:hemoglobin/transferrin/lactoferrin receptor protein
MRKKFTGTLRAVSLFLMALRTSATAHDFDDSKKPEAVRPLGTEQGDPRSEASTLIYSVNRSPERAFHTARAVQVITAEDIWRRGARTLPEALMEEAGIFVQQTNYASGAPIIRGLIGKNILILLNGVKVNTATYRFGPLQYLSTIDVAMVERIEIVRGVASVLGGEALAGIINIITTRGPTGGPSLGARVSSRISTADGGFIGHAEGSGHGEKYRFMAGGTHRTFGDLEGGRGTPGQKAGYGERAFNLTFDFFHTPRQTLSLGYVDLRQSDVPRPDRIVDGTDIFFTYEPQQLQLLSLGYQDVTDRKLADSLQVTGFWNRQTEGSQEVRTATPTRQTELSDQQNVLGFSVEASVFPREGHRVVYGIDYAGQKIRSSGRDINFATQAVTPRRGNWTDGARYRSLGIYIQDRFTIRGRFTLTVGGRYGRFSSAGRENTPVGVLDIQSNQSGFTGALNSVFHVTPRVNLVGSVSRGFRAPNLDDVSVFSDRGAAGIEVPNPTVRPERIVTFEGGVKFDGASFEGSAFYYASSLTDLLVRAAGTVNGLPFFDLNRDAIRGPGEPLVLQRQNVGEARIHGQEVSGRWRPDPSVTLFGSYTRTVGDDETADVPLARIPPGFGTAGLRWSGAAKGRPWVEGVYVFAAAQTRLNPTDITDSRIGPTGTKGFNVFHMRGGASFGRLRLRVGLENLTDQLYKFHGSGIFRPGRQLVFGAEYRF